MQRWVPAPGLGLAVLMFQGCLYIPTPEHSFLAARGRIDQNAMKELVPGQATRADVLLRFGAPSEVMEGGRIFAYRWERVHGYFVWGIGYGYSGVGGALPVQKDHYLLLEFGADGRLKRFDFVRPWLLENPREHVQKWMRGEGGSPPERSADQGQDGDTP